MRFQRRGAFRTPGDTMPSSRLPAKLHYALSALLLVSALVLGGGQGWLGDTFCQLLALALIAVAAWRHFNDDDARWSGAAWLVLVPLAVPLLQLLPVPESWWGMASGRAQLATELAQAGADDAGRWSLVPLATERSLWWLLPAIAMFLAGLQFESAQRRSLMKLVVLVAAISVVLGLAQLAGGPESALRFYSNTNRTEAVGFFANRNHFASLLAAALPLVIVGLAVWQRRRDNVSSATVIGMTAGLGLIALLILGLAMSRSRGGLVLGMLAVLLSLPLALKLRQQSRGSRRLLAAAVAVGLMLSVQFAMFGIMQRLQKDPFEDARFRYAQVTAPLASTYLPLGTGLGGFRAAYEAAEVPPAETAYANHAHNDYIELWLETGWLVVPAALVLGIGFAFAGVRAWRRLFVARVADADALRCAAWLSLLLFILHSLADYPLRTTALLAVAGLLAASSTFRQESRNPA